VARRPHAGGLILPRTCLICIREPHLDVTDEVVTLIEDLTAAIPYGTFDENEGDRELVMRARAMLARLQTRDLKDVPDC
jgi:hypothetical protein